MPLVPSFDPMPLGSAAWLLQGLYLANMDELRQGVPGILAALAPGRGGARRLRYIRRDPSERWQLVSGIWRRGGGDCEDLAAATAAELTLAGEPARPIIRAPRPGGTTAHAMVQLLRNGQLLDPSRLGGMGEPRELAEARGVTQRARSGRVTLSDLARVASMRLVFPGV